MNSKLLNRINRSNKLLKNIKMRMHYIPFLFSVCIIFDSCEKELSFEERDRFVNISYSLTISEDLLKFVSPEVTYNDTEGNKHTISGVEELDSLVNVNFVLINNLAVVTSQKIEGTGYKAWTLNMLFHDYPLDSFFEVKYRKLSLAEADTNMEYDFHHSIYSTIFDFRNYKGQIEWFGKKTDVDTDINLGEISNFISFTKNSIVQGKDVESYLDSLVNTPDYRWFTIGDDGILRSSELGAISPIKLDLK